jgi:ribulose-phosphate 3-epimerase
MLKCTTSLWSADLSNLAAEMKRVEPYSERFHIDVADGHYVKNLLFFPDLVKAIRKHTTLPLEVHLMTTEPMDWIEPFEEAGVDGFIFCFDALADPLAVLQAARARGKQAGVSLLIDEPVEVLAPYWDYLDTVTIIGTAMGIKGASMNPCVPDKIRQAREIITRRGLKTEIYADGGIRRETVPLIAAAGADYIVPGSLMFKEDPSAMRAWLASLEPR